jgi:RNA polymerase primary sigma factor
MLNNLSKKNTISNYLGSLQAHPQLEHDELVELFQAYEKGGRDAVKARQKLTESNLRLVVYIAKKQKGHNIPLEDLIQEGNLGLLKAIDKFDWKKGFRFSTYATWWIKQAISQYVLKRKKIIRLPAHAVSAQKKLIEASDAFKELKGYGPTSEELSELIDVSETVVKATMQSGKNIVSLQQQIGDDGNSTLEAKLEDTNFVNDPFESLAKKEMLVIVKNVMSNLSVKEAAILRLRFGLYEDIEAKDYQITEEEANMITSGQGLA